MSSFLIDNLNLRCHREICPSMDLLKPTHRSYKMGNLAQECLLLNLLLKTSRGIATKCYYYLLGILLHLRTNFKQRLGYHVLLWHDGWVLYSTLSRLCLLMIGCINDADKYVRNLSAEKESVRPFPNTPLLHSEASEFSFT